ncbi:MAG: hypothetical protein J6R77_07180 [Clostridia bacterium]|nr:hypothetical protein [Clostridia bacterium]
MAHALGIKPDRVRADIRLSIQQKVFVYVKEDTARDCLEYLDIPTPPAPPAPPAGQLVTVSCPHCGAQVTISTTRGGQCEYCDSWLPGTE